MSTIPSLSADLSDSWGLVLVASFLAMGLWSVYSMQMFMYFFNYPKDSKGIKVMVVWLWVVSTAHVSMIIAASYNHFIKKFGDLEQFKQVSPEIIWLLLPTTLIALTVQSFFLWRIWLFDGKNYRLPVALGIGMTFQLGGNIYTLYVGQTVTDVGQLWAADHVMLAYYAIAACVDVLIAGIMIYLLWRRRVSDDGVKISHTSRIVYRLMILSINSGLWTAVFAIGVLILSVLFENSVKFSICYFPLAHLYSNCLLANLTTRNYIRTAGDATRNTLDFNVISLSNRSDQDNLSPKVIISTETHQSSDITFAIPGPSSKHVGTNSNPV